MGLLDNLARGVQNLTGETERKQIVEETKNEYINSRNAITNIVNQLNLVILSFNQKIDYLNNLRLTRVKGNIEGLGKFLSTFGTVKGLSAYSHIHERGKTYFTIPERAFEEVENYIEDIDWSSDEVFMRTFFSGGIGAIFFTKQQNMKMLEKLEEFRNEVMHMKNKLNNKITMLEKVDLRICDIYTQLVSNICDYIENKIVPQIYLIESFLECESVKNAYIADTSVKELSNVEYEKDIMIYNNTIYQKHYNFIRNAFWFYILSATIYSSPILTKLLENKTITDSDIKKLDGQKTLYAAQVKALEDNSL